MSNTKVLSINCLTDVLNYPYPIVSSLQLKSRNKVLAAAYIKQKFTLDNLELIVPFVRFFKVQFRNLLRDFELFHGERKLGKYR